MYENIVHHYQDITAYISSLPYYKVMGLLAIVVLIIIFIHTKQGSYGWAQVNTAVQQYKVNEHYIYKMYS